MPARGSRTKALRSSARRCCCAALTTTRKRWRSSCAGSSRRASSRTTCTTPTSRPGPRISACPSTKASASCARCAGASRACASRNTSSTSPADTARRRSAKPTPKRRTTAAGRSRISAARGTPTATRKSPSGGQKPAPRGEAAQRALKRRALCHLTLLERGHVALRNAARTGPDLDAAGLQRLRHLALQLDGQEPVLEARADDLQVLGEIEALAEGPARDPPVQDLGALLLLGVLMAGNEQGVLL